MNNFFWYCTPTFLTSLLVAVSASYLKISSILHQDGQKQYMQCDEIPSEQQNQKGMAANYSVDSSSIGTNPRAEILFLGTGSSTDCPKPLCTLLSHLNGIEVLPE
eukprot:4336131-Ditylum_brightwellii.AAC.1